jgi:hypothetical protein
MAVSGLAILAILSLCGLVGSTGGIIYLSKKPASSEEVETVRLKAIPLGEADTAFAPIPPGEAGTMRASWNGYLIRQCWLIDIEAEIEGLDEWEWIDR